MSVGIPVTLVSTIIRQNQNDVERMAFYAYRHKLPWVATGSVKPSLRGASTDPLAVAVTEKLEEQRRRKMEARLREGRFVDLNRKPATYCRDYRLGYWVVWNGMMRFCSFMDEPNIPVREVGFPAAWQRLLQYEEELEWPENSEMKQCPFDIALDKKKGW